MVSIKKKIQVCFISQKMCAVDFEECLKNRINFVKKEAKTFLNLLKLESTKK